MENNIRNDHKSTTLLAILEGNTQTNKSLWKKEITLSYIPHVKELYIALQKLPRNKVTYSYLHLLSQAEDFAYYELLSSLNPEYNECAVFFLQKLKAQPENWQYLQLKYHLERTVKGFRYHGYFLY